MCLLWDVRNFVHANNVIHEEVFETERAAIVRESVQVDNMLPVFSCVREGYIQDTGIDPVVVGLEDFYGNSFKINVGRFALFESAGETIFEILRVEAEKTSINLKGLGMPLRSNTNLDELFESITVEISVCLATLRW